MRGILCWLFFLALMCQVATCFMEGNLFDGEGDPDSESNVLLELPKKGQDSGMSFIVLRKPPPEPLRIRVSIKDIQNSSRYCGPGDQVSGARRPDFRGSDVPCEMADVLTYTKKSIFLRSVIPAAVKMHTDRLMVKPVKGLIKLERFNSLSCREFTLPENHSTNGLIDVDFVLYLATGPHSLFALPCVLLETNRPFAGAMNFAPRHIASDERTIRLATHEIAHALGFNQYLLNHLGLVKEKDDKKYFTKKAKNTLTVLKAIFQCNKLQDVLLDDEDGTGDEYHFDRRYAKSDLMASKMDDTASYSSLTLSVFHDLGFYEPVYARAEPIIWGIGSPCDVVTSNCESLDTQKYPGMFCNVDDTHKQCTSDYLSVGSCKKSNGCFFVESDKDSQCVDTSIGGKPGNKRCVERKNSSNGKFLDAMCAEISCNEVRDAVMVRFNESDEFQLCPDGQTLSKSPYEVVICPSYNKICPLSLH